jgi:hypothetical protein
MSDVLFGRGARGHLIEQLQAGLGQKGFAIKPDGDYGDRTETAVRAFQTAAGAGVTGAVSRVQWTSLTGRDVPALKERCLQLTAAFEGHQYTVAAGNFDGAWLRWGIVGFTMKYGRVQRIVLTIDRTAPNCIRDAFGANSEALLRAMRGTAAEQQAWATSISLGRRLVEPWQTAFATFGGFAEVQQAQRQVAFDDYFTPAVHTAGELGLSSELGIALCFDIHVQNGGVSQEVRATVDPIGANVPEQKRREQIANGVADHARPEYRENVRRRKLAIATGAGEANGVRVVLENWGLAAVPAVV